MSASKKRRELNRARVEHDAARIAAGGAVSAKHMRDTTLEVAMQAIDQLRAENERQRAVLEDVKIYLQDSGAPQHIYHRVLEGIFGKVIGGTV